MYEVLTQTIVGGRPRREDQEDQGDQEDQEEQEGQKDHDAVGGHETPRADRQGAGA